MQHIGHNCSVSMRLYGWMDACTYICMYVCMYVCTKWRKSVVDVRCLILDQNGTFLWTVSLLTNNTATQAHQQRTTTAFFSPHLSYSCYKSIEGYTNGIPTRTLQKGYDRASNSNLQCTQASTSWTTISPPLSSTNKGHYLPPSLVLSSLRRPLHSESTYARDLLKTK